MDRVRPRRGSSDGRLYTIRKGPPPYDIKSLPGIYDTFDAYRLEADARPLLDKVLMLEVRPGFVNSQQVLPGAKFALESQALGDLEPMRSCTERALAFSAPNV